MKEDREEIPQEILDRWPNCSVPDCPWKSCTWLGTGMCYQHSIYGRLVPVSRIIIDRMKGLVP